MTSFTYTFSPADTDVYGRIPPRALISAFICAGLEQFGAEGIGGNTLAERYGGAWMLSGLRLEQYEPVSPGKVSIYMSERAVKGALFYRLLELRDEDKLLCSCRMSCFAVNIEQRYIYRPEAIVKDTTGSESAMFSRLRVRASADRRENHTVRWSECDGNGHFTSAKYADLICDHCGYWAKGPAVMDRLDIDYNHESLPGEQIELLIGGEDTGFVKGVRSDGSAAFTSVYKFSRI